MIRLSSVILCLTLYLSLAPRAEAGDTERPNVVFIVADDIGWNDIAAYSSIASPGHDTSSVVRTPHIDEMARRGMMFTDAHTPMALCAPNRFSLLTGSNPYRNGRPGGSWGLSSSSGFTTGTDRTGKLGRHLTAGDVMQTAGYKTGFVGKTHLGASAFDLNGRELWKTRTKNKADKHDLFLNMDYSHKVEDSISEHGFDYAFTMEDGIQGPPYAYFENGLFQPIDPGKPADNSSVKDWRKQKGHVVGNNGDSGFAHGPFVGDVDFDSSQVGIRLADKAVEFIDQASHEKQPFFLYYCSQAVHWPHTPPIDFDGDPTTIDQPVKGVTPGPTSDMIYELDLQVGAILQKLKDEGILGNTLVVFASDNGGLKPSVVKVGQAEHDTTGVLRGHKATFFEGGHRVPFIAMWGDGTSAGSKIAPGAVNHQLIAVHDWVATLYDLTNQNMDDGQAMDSVSLLPTLLGRRPLDQPIREFMEFGFGGIRVGDYFLLCDRNNPHQASELYDLSNDLAQETNLIDDPNHQERIKSMLTMSLEFNNRDRKDLSEPRSTPVFRAR